ALDNSRGVVGVTPGIGLYSVKVMDDSGFGTVSSVVAGIEWANDQNIPVINMSLGLNTYNKTLQDAVDNAYANGLLMVAAVGNTSGGSVFYPAAYSSVIAVAASDSSDRLAPFSSVGPEVELIAPGVSITSTFPGSRYASLDGTSMASPHVAGAAALTWSVNSSLDNTEVRQILRQSAQDLSLPADHQGYGLVKADLAVAAAVPEPPSDKAFFGVGLYEKFNSKFYLKYNTEAGNADHTFSFYGSHNDWIPVSGDWSDDGFHSGAIYDQQEGRFHIKDDTNSGYADRTFRYGPKGNDWLPVAGDWDGDGIYGVALYNQTDGIFYIKDHTTPGPADRTFRYGPRNNDWLPVAGDWTGDGEYGVALYNQRDGIFYIKDRTTPGPADRTFRYGPRNNDWLPATGDWTGDGIYGVALYDQLNGRFFVKNQTTPGPADCTFRFGPRNNNWFPLAGIWQK
ncbi:MAG: S8 family peptidase, partial [Bacillota bacterium]